MKIVPASELGGSPKILIYGKPGVGKTVLASQAPRPTLLLDFDYGAKRGLTRKLLELGVDTSELDIVRDPNLDEVEKLAQRVARKEPFRYKSMVLDSLTELQMWHRTMTLGDKLRATRDDYGLNIEWVRRVVRNLCHSDLTVIFTCLQDEQEAEDGMWIGPALTPSLLRSVEALVDTIVYLSSRVAVSKSGVATVDRQALTANMDRIRAKDRDGVLPVMVSNPTWGSLFGPLYQGSAPEVLVEEVESDDSPLSES